MRLPGSVLQLAADHGLAAQYAMEAFFWFFTGATLAALVAIRMVRRSAP